MPSVVPRPELAPVWPFYAPRVSNKNATGEGTVRMGTWAPSVGGLPVLPTGVQKHHVPILAGSFGCPACPVLQSSFQDALESLPCLRRCGPEQGVFISYALPPSYPSKNFDGAMPLNTVEQNPGSQGGAGILIIQTMLWKILPDRLGT